MTRHALVALMMLVASLVLGMFAPPAARAGFGPETFEDGTCVSHSCTYSSVEADHGEAFTQAAGHPQWGITKFVMKHSGSTIEGASVKRIRVDVPPGLAANPEALPKCSIAQFQSNPRGCPSSSEVGSTELEAVAEPLGIPASLPTLTGTVYNLEPPVGLPLDFGIAVEPAGDLVTPIHLFLEGHLAWWSDYHEYFEINDVPNEAEVKLLLGVKSPLKVLMSKLNFNGRAGQGNFLTLPSVCSSTTTSHLELESWSGEIATAVTHTPVGVEGCNHVPFSPSVTVSPETAQSDSPDGATTIVQVPQKVREGEINTSDIQDAHVRLPEGLTLNPSAAQGLGTCSAAQIAIGTTSPVTCPPGARIGSVTIETDLPPGSLTGNAYLGSPSGAPVTGPPYTIYLDAESARYGVSVRLQGSVDPNPQTGQLEASFANNPPLPFSELRLTLNGGEHAPLANPLICGSGSTSFALTPYTGSPADVGATPFATSGCPSPLPFSLAQSTDDTEPNAGSFGSTAFTFDLSRADGQQYLSSLATVLPAGLVGAIPSVTLCGEPQAQDGGCPAGSRIGTATAEVGAGDPYPFTGPVFLTGPYAGSPFGLSIPIQAAAGPFDLGTIVTRAAINVDPKSGRVTASSTLPRIFAGIPLRLRGISVAINRPNFLINPTDCAGLATETTLTSVLNATDDVSSPFAVSNCSALHFKPTFAAASSAQTSRAIGAALKVDLTQGAHQANIHSVVVQLPLQLPSRFTTLQKACPEATYAANPFDCPTGSKVGSATVTTPVLPDALSGPAYLVSHGGGAFPDLDLLLEGDGVHVILEGSTNIKAGITTSTFASIPDVPVSSFVLDLPTGPNSALATNGSLCSGPLVMPTTITAQSGAQVQQSTILSVAGCPFGSFRHKNPHPPPEDRRPHPDPQDPDTASGPDRRPREEPADGPSPGAQGGDRDAEGAAVPPWDEGRASERAPASEPEADGARHVVATTQGRILLIRRDRDRVQALAAITRPRPWHTRTRRATAGKSPLVGVHRLLHMVSDAEAVQYALSRGAPHRLAGGGNCREAFDRSGPRGGLVGREQAAVDTVADELRRSAHVRSRAPGPRAPSPRAARARTAPRPKGATARRARERARARRCALRASVTVLRGARLAHSPLQAARRRPRCRSAWRGRRTWPSRSAGGARRGRCSRTSRSASIAVSCPFQGLS